MLAAEWGLGQMIWSLFVFFVFVMWIMLVINVFTDIVRSKDLSGGSKALWTILIVFLPYFGVFLYLLLRGASMHERQEKELKEGEAAFHEYLRNASGGTDMATQLHSVSELHAQGKLTDEEFAASKAKILSS